MFKITTITEKIDKRDQPFKVLGNAEYKKNIYCWKRDYPDYDNLKVGMVIEGETILEPEGQFPKLVDPEMPIKANYRPKGIDLAKPKFIAEAQERKAEYIKEAQQNKEHSIAYFNSVNSAIATLGKYEGLRGEEEMYRDNLVEWRDWFLKEYENWSSSPGF